VAAAVLVATTLLSLPLAACRCGRASGEGESRRVIDAHTHIGLGAGDLAAAALSRSGVEVAMNYVGRRYDARLQQYLDEARAVSAAHERFELLVLAGIDWSTFGDPQFGELAADNLRRAHAAGARGLKVFKSLGLGVRTADGELLPVDTPMLDPVWRVAGELDIPVAIHTGDPLAFFEAPTPANERYEELRAHPSWSFYGRDYPSLAELMAARDRMVARHPGTRFLAVHFGGFPEDPESVAASLRSHANLWIDLAARVPEIGRHDPERMRAFFEEFQDRILFGTDLQLSTRHVVLGSAGDDERRELRDIDSYYDVHWRYLETRERGFAHVTPIQGRWTIDGIGLSRRVLDKIYHDNARRLFRLESVF
jgi:predicted TIM-barrel fold metal-dependent hydrolase